MEGYKYKVRYETWVEEGNCSLQLVFHFADKEGADRFVKSRGLELRPSSTIAHIWHELYDTPRDVGIRNLRNALVSGLDANVEKSLPEAQAPEEETAHNAVGEK